MSYYRTTVEIRTRSLDKYLAMKAWCEEQWGKVSGYADDTWACRETVTIGYTVFHFDREQDAVFFKLKWA